MRNIAVILAAGTGSRFGSELPKQFLEINGKTVLEYSVDRFEMCDAIDDIFIVSHPDFRDRVGDIVSARGWAKVSKIISGGKERTDSTLAAIEACGTGSCNIIFHDAVRALISNRIIVDVVEALQNNKAVTVALPVVDTIMEGENGEMIKTIDRSRLYRVQTPQGFHLGTIRDAYRKMKSESAGNFTDDCSIVRRFLPEVNVAIVRGEETNIKLTHKNDLPLVEYLLSKTE